METYTCIIPARFQSSRFPGKPLCDILGKPMILRTYESVLKWGKWKSICVATDSVEIGEACKKYDIPYLYTRTDHIDCLDRASEVASLMDNEGFGSDKYIIIQGDEPLFNVETLNVDMSPSVINFYTEVHDNSELYDTNAVKVILSNNKKALYFSRYTVPYHGEKTKRSNDGLVCFKQIGVYIFTGEMLKLYNRLNSSYLEKMEGIGLNRLLENDIEVHMRYTKYDSISVDTPSDRDRIINLIKKDYENKNMSIDDNGNIINCNGDRMP